MDKHSKHFEYLEDYFAGIERYSKYHDTAINIKAFQFWLILEEVNTDFHSFGKSALLDNELPIIQGWINKIIGNRNIPKETREKIANASVDFASMVESINNSHIDTLNSLNF